MDSLTNKTYLPARTVAMTRRFLHSVPEVEAKMEDSMQEPLEEAKEVPKVNTNVMGINFSEVENANYLATGDPIRCEKCLAYFNAFSKYDRVTKTWICEFCDYPNVVSLEEEELPENDIITYIDPNQDEVKTTSSNPTSVSPTVIFCIDISGSMSSTTICPNQLKYMREPGHISRLECVKLAVDEQLQKLAKDAPDTKVGLVLFSDEVVLMGDESVPNYTLKADINDYNAILAEAQSLVGKYVTRPLKDTLPGILAKLNEVTTEGITALGPALLLSVGLITGQPGSKVILCTDGAANRGIGQARESRGSEVANLTYHSIGELALTRGAVISLVSLAEEDCRLDIIAPCAMRTGGNIVKINPMDLSGDFATFLEEKIIAFGCTVAVKLHRAMKFVTVNTEDLSPDPSVLVKKLGNVVPTLVFTFEYVVKSPEELLKEKICLAKRKSLPFQALLNYVGPDKVRYCKVISKTQDITYEQLEAAQNVNVDVLTAHSMKKTADYAIRGNIKEAQNITRMYRTLVKGKKEEEESYNNAVRNIENSVEQETKTVAFRQGHKSDHLVASVAVTQKFCPKKR